MKLFLRELKNTAKEIVEQRRIRTTKKEKTTEKVDYTRPKMYNLKMNLQVHLNFPLFYSIIQRSIQTNSIQLNGRRASSFELKYWVKKTQSGFVRELND